MVLLGMLPHSWPQSQIFYICYRLYLQTAHLKVDACLVLVVVPYSQGKEQLESCHYGEASV